MASCNGESGRKAEGCKSAAIRRPAAILRRRIERERDSTAALHEHPTHECFLLLIRVGTGLMADGGALPAFLLQRSLKLPDPRMHRRFDNRAEKALDIFKIIPHVFALSAAYALAFPIGWDRESSRAARHFSD
jgi:hypothetical protein